MFERVTAQYEGRLREMANAHDVELEYVRAYVADPSKANARQLQDARAEITRLAGMLTETYGAMIQAGAAELHLRKTAPAIVAAELAAK